MKCSGAVENIKPMWKIQPTVNVKLFPKCPILVTALFVPYRAAAKCLALQKINRKVHVTEHFQMIGFIYLYLKYFFIFKHKRGCTYGFGMK